MAEKESDLQYYTKKLPAPIRNKYVFVGLLFLLLMLFFDRYNVFTQLRLQQSVRGLREKIKFHAEDAKRSEETQKAIFSSESTLERFAREKYFMHRPSEDVFVVEEK